MIRFTVIRKGKGIGTVNVEETNPNELANLMVGREVVFTTQKIPSNPKTKCIRNKRFGCQGF